MSDTPRTDYEAFPIKQEEVSGMVVDIEFARQLEREKTELLSALERIVKDIPACDGSLYIEHHDGDGNYLGREDVDPLAVIENINGIARDAIAKAQQ